MAANTRGVLSLLGRFSKAEAEFNTLFTPLTTLRSPTSIRTDRIISFLLIHFRGRIAIGTAALTALTVDPLRNLIQEIRVSGTHTTFGAAVPFRIRAKTQNDINKIYGINYAPRDKVLKGGAAGTFDGTVANFDVDVFWQLPLFPVPTPLQIAPLYSLKGPDWAGNLFVEFDTADGTVLGTYGAGTTVTFTAYGVATGSPTVYVDVIRPLVTVDLMNKISPAIPYRSYRPLDTVMQGASFTLGKIADLNIGKKFVSFHLETGALQAGTSAGTRAYSAMSDGIVTRTVASLDGKFLALPSSALSQQESDSLMGGQTLQTGYSVYNFCRETGNPDTAFPAETLTAARRFEVDGDVTAAAAQGAELVQDELLGSPLAQL